MWTQYRKTLYPTQGFILALCLLAYLKFGVAPLGALWLFGVMQVAAILGAIWSVRLRRKIERALLRREQHLPDLLA
jgi:hypothetical protein